MVAHETSLDHWMRHARRERLWEPGPTTRALDVRGAELQRVLRHRPPMLLVDAVTAIDGPQLCIAGTRTLHADDPVFAGHFPGDPVYPGTLLMEAMAQLASCFRPLEHGEPPQRALPTAYRGAFLRATRPGDTLTLLGRRVGAWDGLMERGVCQVLRGEEICAICTVEACYVDG